MNTDFSDKIHTIRIKLVKEKGNFFVPNHDFEGGNYDSPCKSGHVSLNVGRSDQNWQPSEIRVEVIKTKKFE